MCTQYNENYLTAGCWSPTRPGVFFTTKDNGELDVWDFAFKQNAPSLAGVKVSDAALQSISPEPRGALLGVGDAGGNCTWQRKSQKKQNSPPPTPRMPLLIDCSCGTQIAGLIFMWH